MTNTMSKAAIAISVFLLVSGCSSDLESAAADDRQQPPAETHSISPAQHPAPTPDNLPALTDKSTLSDYLAYAALNNPGLEAAFNTWKAALEQIPQVKALPDPRFEYKYFIQEVETRVGPQRNSFAISQMFPWFGKLDLRGDIASDAARAARQRYEAAKLKLFYEVKDAYFEYYYLAKSIAVTKDNIDLVTHLEEVALIRYKAAAASHPDVIRAQVELGKLEDRHRSLLDMRRPIIARLNAALNRPVDTQLPSPDEIAFDEVRLADTQLLEKLITDNPQLKALDADIAQNRKNIELAKKDYYPDVMIGLNVIDTGDSLYMNQPDSGKDPVIASLSINLPIWQQKYAAGVRQARLQHLAAQRQRLETANSLSSRLQMTLYAFRDAERKIYLYRDTLLPKAQESLKVTETAFRTADGTFTDLIDAQRILLEFSLSCERALANRSQALAMLEMLIGGEIPNTGNPGPDSNVQNPIRNADTEVLK
jgi:outer membrane protein TolC